MKKASGKWSHGLVFLGLSGLLLSLQASSFAAEPAASSVPSSDVTLTNEPPPFLPPLDADARLALVFADWDHLIADWEESWDDVGPGLVSYIDEARMILQGELQRIHRNHQSSLAELRAQLQLLRPNQPPAVPSPMQSHPTTETNRQPVSVSLASLIPDEHVWTMSGHLREFVGNWIDREDKGGVDLVFLLQQPLKEFNEKLKQLDQEGRRNVAKLRTELAELKATTQTEPRPPTNTVARPIPPNPAPAPR